MSGLPAKQPFKAALLLLLGTVGWGLSFPTMKALELSQRQLLPGDSSWFFTSISVAVRFGFAGIVVFLFSWRTLRSLTRNEFLQGAGLALFGSAGLLLQMDGLVYTAASTSAFLTQCYCLIIPLIVAFRTRSLPSPVIFIGSLMVATGVAVLARFDWHATRLGRGELETLLASLFFTGQILWLERPRFAGNNINHMTVVMFFLSALCALPVVLFSTAHIQNLGAALFAPAPMVLLGILTLICTLGSYVIMNYWQPHLEASQAGLIYCVEPVFASVFALFLPGWFSQLAAISYGNEVVTRELLLGGGLISTANVLILIDAARRKPVARAYTSQVPAKSTHS